jgi:hypothetical protein
LGVDIVAFALGDGVFEDIQYSCFGVVAAADVLGAAGREADLGAVFPVYLEADEAVSDLEAVGGNFAEIFIIDDLAVVGFIVRDEYGGGRCRWIHSEDPDGWHAGFLGPGGGAAVDEGVLGAVGDDAYSFRNIQPQKFLCPSLFQNGDHPAEADVEFISGGIAEGLFLYEYSLGAGCGFHVIRLGIEESRNIPVGIHLLFSWLEEPGERTALRAYPKAFFASERIELGFDEPVGQGLVVEPTEAGSFFSPGG